MNLTQAKKELKEFIEKMKMEESEIFYAAIVKKKDIEYGVEYGIEYGINEGAKVFYDVPFNKLSPQLDPDKNIKKTISTTNVGKLLLGPNQEKIRPLKGGISVCDNSSDLKSGTLGAFFNVRENDNIYFISNMHVLSYFLEIRNDAQQTFNQEKIVQPSRLDAAQLNYGYEDNPIGTTVWKQFHGTMDVAVAKLDRGIEIDRGFFNGKEKIQSTIGDLPENFLYTYKYGRTSGYTEGKIISTNAAIRIKNLYNSINQKGEIIVFEDQIMTEDMAAEGDSGSLLIKMDHYPIGLTFANIGFKLPYTTPTFLGSRRAQGRTFHNKLENIFRRMEKGLNYDNTSYPLTFKNFI